MLICEIWIIVSLSRCVFDDLLSHVALRIAVGSTWLDSLDPREQNGNMKHRRGIEIGRPRRDAITYLGPVMDPAHTTFDDIQQWYALGGHCSKCEREAWVDRWEVEKKWGSQTYLGPLAPRLRCLACNHKGSNKWILGQLPR